MRDRTPQHAGRVQLVPVAGQTNIYDMSMADGATEQGTALNKANLLKDATAALFGLPNSAVPDDVFARIGTYINTEAVKIETGSYVGTGTYGANNPTSITFGFIPKFVYISELTVSTGSRPSTTVGGVGATHAIIDYAALIDAVSKGVIENRFYASTGPSGNGQLETFSLSNGNKTLSWYNTSSASNQLNRNGIYHYLAIG